MSHDFLADLPPLLTDKQIAELLTVCVMTVTRMRKRGELPPTIQVSPRRHATRSSAIRQLLKERERK